MKNQTILLLFFALITPSILLSQAIGTVDPNSADQGESLTVTISGINTSWGQETGTFWTVSSPQNRTV